MSYLIIAFIGAILAMGYWWGMQSIFASKKGMPIPPQTAQEPPAVQPQANSALGLEMKIGGFVRVKASKDSTQLELAVRIVNHNQVRTAYNWKLTLKNATGNRKTIYLPGQERAKGSFDLPRLDEVLHNPLGANNEVTGLLNFLIPGIPSATFDKLKDDPTAVLVLSVLDNSNQEWTTKRSISEMAKEKFEYIQ